MDLEVNFHLQFQNTPFIMSNNANDSILTYPELG